ncbi:MAG TPA: 16S rRNA (uracil(1498)-N(3))-methyltransferase [Actinocrinis sp.]|uniref:16S rRNA (uracil(1498)-N(3))-methyltransferase n=1 Tax=Actinocrinis sp. TaxID=1920516 RepID=UPI002DDD79A9|nr:16S rRNA (uracil(1498)-N(3))-methyltransferase [Actinocrinis sp.]HEV2347117.1 16S rRNA (uracil(1498)-N(3))-methyltransferase [Actinocrinis sp.]
MTSVPVFHVGTDKLSGATIRLDGPEGRHAALVRRLRPGERVDLTDGAGRLAECVVRASGSSGDPALELDVLGHRTLPRPEPRITVVQALAKGDRGETAVETMTEIGVDVIVPWSASRSIVQWRADRGEKALAKWRSTAAEASKQSRRAWWPEVTQSATTTHVAQLLAKATLGVVLHEEGELSLADLTAAHSKDWTGDIVLIVGPEGGISPEELRVFADAGGASYRMGPTVLRTSTAGTAAAAVLLARSGRWAASN